MNVLVRYLASRFAEALIACAPPAAATSASGGVFSAGDVWLRDGASGNVTFIPSSFFETLRYDKDAGENGAFEVLAHASESTEPNTTAVHTDFYTVESFSGLEHVDETVARLSHPAFFEFLRNLDKGEDERAALRFVDSVFEQRYGDPPATFATRDCLYFYGNDERSAEIHATDFGTFEIILFEVRPNGDGEAVKYVEKAFETAPRPEIAEARLREAFSAQFPEHAASGA